jgi:hypothetical protein
MAKIHQNQSSHRISSIVISLETEQRVHLVQLSGYGIEDQGIGVQFQIQA